jgi:predicted transposase/invertase (TIGR01784 family)
MTELFSPKVDYVFKNIFGNEKHPNILISFLNACIKPKYPIEKVNIRNTEINKEFVEDSYSRLDILATTSTGEVINIEMQRKDQHNMIKRSLYYWSKVYSSEYQGKSLYSKLPRTICINILDFELLDEENYHNTYVLKNRENNHLLTDDLELHFIEIPKMKAIDLDDMLSIWTAFLEDPNNNEVVELEKKYSALHEAREELTRISRDPKEREAYRMRENSQNDKADAIATANERGRIQGRAEGREEGVLQAKIENAKSAILNGFDDDVIIKIVGLSIEEIKAIRESMK